MKELLLSPKRVATYASNIYSIPDLEKYWDSILSGKDISPVSVVDIQIYSIDNLRRDLEQFFEIVGSNSETRMISLSNLRRFEVNLSYVMRQGARYLLCDGNHRSLAFALSEKKIPCRQIENLSDLEELNTLSGTGDLVGTEMIMDSVSPHPFYFNPHPPRTTERFLFSLYHDASKHHRLISIESKREELLAEDKILIEGKVLKINLPEPPF